MIDLGIVKPGKTIRIPINTFDSNDPQASATVTGLAAADVEIYKDGSTTQRASDSGYTVTTDFDTTTGVQLIAIDLADNTTAGFFASGSEYIVVVGPFTLDAATINAAVARFEIGMPDADLNTTIATLASQTSFTLTSGPAENDALNGCVMYAHDVASSVQVGYAVVSDYVGSTKTVTLTAGPTFTMAATDNVHFYPPANVNWVTGTAQTAGDIPALVTTVDTVVDGIQTDLDNGTDGLGAIKADTAAILTDTADMQPKLGTPAGASISADIATVDSNVDAILVDTGTTLPAQITTAQNDLDTITGSTGVIIDNSEVQSLVDNVWDEVLTGGTHNVSNSAGRRLRSIQEFQGYENGAVWLDTNNGTTGTTSYENGTVENPVDTLANATTIATNVGLKAFHIINGSSITLAQTYSNYDFVGQEWTLALGGQAITGSFFRNVTQGVSGTATGTTPFFEECSIGAATLPPCAFDRCGFTSTLTLGSAGNYFLVDCFSQIAGASSPTIDMGAAVGATNLSVRRWSGGITLNNLASGDVVSLDGTFGTITLNGADAQVEIRGIAKAVVNNLTGSPTVNDNSVKETQIDTISSGIIEGTAATGTLSTTVATTDLTGYADDQLIGRVIIWTSGACEGEATLISDYANTNGQLTFTALTTAPANGDSFKIV